MALSLMKTVISCSGEWQQFGNTGCMSRPLAFSNVGTRSRGRMKQFLSAAGGETEVRVIKWDLGRGYTNTECNNASLRLEIVECDSF